MDNISSQDMYRENANAWEQMPIQNMHPDINLMKTHKRLFPDVKGKKILFIGFGEGQNLLYFASIGALCSGTELAQSRIDETKRKIDTAGVSAHLMHVDSPRIPLEDDMCDIVIAWQSLYYNNEETLKESLGEVYRVLQAGGVFISSMLSVQHNLCAEEIAPFVYKPARTPAQKDCIVYCLKDKNHAKETYAQFRDVHIGYYDNELFGARDFHYVIVCKK